MSSRLKISPLQITWSTTFGALPQSLSHMGHFQCFKQGPLQLLCLSLCGSIFTTLLYKQLACVLDPQTAASLMIYSSMDHRKVTVSCCLKMHKVLVNHFSDICCELLKNQDDMTYCFADLWVLLVCSNVLSYESNVSDSQRKSWAVLRKKDISIYLTKEGHYLIGSL